MTRDQIELLEWFGVMLLAGAVGFMLALGV